MWCEVQWKKITGICGMVLEGGPGRASLKRQYWNCYYLQVRKISLGKRIPSGERNTSKPLKQKSFGVFEELNETSRLQLENELESGKRWELREGTWDQMGNPLWVKVKKSGFLLQVWWETIEDLSREIMWAYGPLLKHLEDALSDSSEQGQTRSEKL